jgi:hypothetical protein
VLESTINVLRCAQCFPIPISDSSHG